jgi:hypothetical protein
MTKVIIGDIHNEQRKKNPSEPIGNLSFLWKFPIHELQQCEKCVKGSRLTLPTHTPRKTTLGTWRVFHEHHRIDVIYENMVCSTNLH